MRLADALGKTGKDEVNGQGASAILVAPLGVSTKRFSSDALGDRKFPSQALKSTRAVDDGPRRSPPVGTIRSESGPCVGMKPRSASGCQASTARLRHEASAPVSDGPVPAGRVGEIVRCRLGKCLDLSAAPIGPMPPFAGDQSGHVGGRRDRRPGIQK